MFQLSRRNVGIMDDEAHEDRIESYSLYTEPVSGVNIKYGIRLDTNPRRLIEFSVLTILE